MVVGYDSLKIEVAENQDPVLTASPTWTDISTSVQTLATNRGRDAFWELHSPGSAQFVFNDDFFGNILPLPNMPIRVSVNDSTSTRKYLFAGFLRPQNGFVTDVYGNVSSTTIQAIDAMGLMAERNFDTAVVSGGLHSGDMIALFAALNAGLFPSWQTAHVDHGQTIVQDVPAGGTFLDQIQNLTFTESGCFYILGNGTVNFDDRAAVGTTSRIATSQVTFDDTGAGDSTYGQHFSLWTPPVYTTASATRANDDSQTLPDGTQGPQTFTFSSTASIALYGVSAFPPITNNLAASNTEVAALVERIVQSSKEVDTCPKTIRLFPRRDNDQLDASVQRELRDRAEWKNFNVPYPSDAEVWVERIQHSIDVSSKEWTCDLSFSSRLQIFFSALVDPSLWFVLNDATLGKLDGNNYLGW